MKAAVITRYGSPDVVKVIDAPKPVPAANEVLVRVHAATVNRTDCGELRADPFFMRFFYGLWRPKRIIFGLDFAGEVEAVGAQTLAFKPGDRVFGMCPSRSNGAQAEYVAVPESAVAAMPVGVRFDEAVVCEGALYATRRRICCHGSRTFRAKPDSRNVVVDDPQWPSRPSGSERRPRVRRLPEEPHGGGPIPSGHRSEICLGGNCGCLPLCRDGAEGRHRRDRCHHGRVARACNFPGLAVF